MASSSSRQSGVVPLQNWIAHKKKSAHNRNMADELQKTPKFVDWFVVTLFYSAVHVVNAYLVKEEGMLGKFVTHGRRKQLIANSPYLSKISYEYNFMETESMQTRYNPTYKIPTKILDEVMKYHLKITAYIDPKL